MHPSAKQWDEKHGVDTGALNKSPHWPKNKPPPENRPCDECGKPVDKGFIHQECIEIEQKRWLDILY